MKPTLIQRRKIYQEVVDHLMVRIRAGEWRPGDHLPSERDLMDAYGVGRPALREALQDLARSGIVEITHGERARIVVPTAELLIRQIASGVQHLLRLEPGMLEQLQDARVFLEAGLCRHAAQHATPAARLRLQQRLAEHREALHQLDQFMLRDMQFHREIAAMSGNPIFPALIEGLFQWAAEFYEPIVRAPGSEQITLAEHARICEAIVAGDGDTAAQAVTEHLLRVNAHYGHATPLNPLNPPAVAPAGLSASPTTSPG